MPELPGEPSFRCLRGRRIGAGAGGRGRFRGGRGLRLRGGRHRLRCRLVRSCHLRTRDGRCGCGLGGRHGSRCRLIRSRSGRRGRDRSGRRGRWRRDRGRLRWCVRCGRPTWGRGRGRQVFRGLSVRSRRRGGNRSVGRYAAWRQSRFGRRVGRELYGAGIIDARAGQWRHDRRAGNLVNGRVRGDGRRLRPSVVAGLDRILIGPFGNRMFRSDRRRALGSRGQGRAGQIRVGRSLRVRGRQIRRHLAGLVGGYIGHRRDRQSLDRVIGGDRMLIRHRLRYRNRRLGDGSRIGTVGTRKRGCRLACSRRSRQHVRCCGGVDLRRGIGWGRRFTGLGTHGQEIGNTDRGCAGGAGPGGALSL